MVWLNFPGRAAPPGAHMLLCLGPHTHWPTQAFQTRNFSSFQSFCKCPPVRRSKSSSPFSKARLRACSLRICTWTYRPQSRNCGHCCSSAETRCKTPFWTRLFCIKSVRMRVPEQRVPLFAFLLSVQATRCKGTQQHLPQSMLLHLSS